MATIQPYPKNKKSISQISNVVDGILLRSKSKMANWKKISEMSPNCELSLSIVTLQNYIQSCLKDEKSTSI